MYSLGMKTSPYKELILSQFKKAHVLSIADVHKAIPKADFSTIFRNVEQLLQAGILMRIVVDADTTVYELVGKGHQHDHFVCVNCGRVDEVHVRKEDIKMVGKSKVLDVVIRGICGPCDSGKKASA